MDDANDTTHLHLPRFTPEYASVHDATAELVKLADALVEQAADLTDTDPSLAQREAGNYRKGKVTLHGHVISIENPRGSTRTGKNKSGTKWSVLLTHHYGYINGTTGRDKDHLDVFIGPDPRNEKLKVYVVNQVDPDTGKWDEHKILMGFASEADAREGYLSCYSDGWKGLGSIKAMTLDKFKSWILQGDHDKRANDGHSDGFHTGQDDGGQSGAKDHEQSDPTTHRRPEPREGGGAVAVGRAVGGDSTAEWVQPDNGLNHHRPERASDAVLSDSTRLAGGADGTPPTEPGAVRPGATGGPGGRGIGGTGGDAGVRGGPDLVSGVLSTDGGRSVERAGGDGGGPGTERRGVAAGGGGLAGGDRTDEPREGGPVHATGSLDRPTGARGTDGGPSGGLRHQGPSSRRSDRFGNAAALIPGEYDYVVQRHDALKAGPHHDLRIGDERGMLSWAVPKGVPGPGERRLAVRTAVHDHGYRNFEGTIPEGQYGAGTIAKHDEGKVTVHRAGEGGIHFSKGDQSYKLLRYRSGGKRQWLLINATPQANSDPVLDTLEKVAAADRPVTLCVDLDGTLASENGKFDPDVIGKPRRNAKKWMKIFHKAGVRLIVWTVRGDTEQVKDWLDDNDIPWDYVNENPDQPDDTSDKLMADLYVDNKAHDASGPWDDVGDEILERLDIKIEDK